MSSETVLPELDVFQLPVFADADIWPMWPAGKLAELADDIKENGFDHRYPITVAEIDGQWMLLDGRNRREAARIAGINPPVIVTDIDPKLAVHRSNNQNRDATPGQKAMAFAMQFPKGQRGGDRGNQHTGGKLTEINLPDSSASERVYISKARFVLRNNPPAPKSQFPQYALDVMAGRMTLTEAYDATQKDVARREEEERIRKEHERKLADIRVRYPELAGLVDEDRLSLSQAVAAAEQKDREAAEEARRKKEEEDARLEEEERQKREAERQETERREARKSTWFDHLSHLLYAESLVSSQAQIELADEMKGTWDEFAKKHMFDFTEARRRLLSLQKGLPDLIEKFEAMR